MELMSSYNAEKLNNFSKHADLIETEIRKIITANGGVIREFKNIEDFLNEV